MNHPDLIFRQLFDPETSTYTYILGDPETKEGVIIDTVIEQHDRDMKVLNELGLNLKYILETHVHADHITGADMLRKKTGATTIVGKGAEIPCADQLIEDGSEIDFGSLKLKALSTPGHTDSCTSYYTEGMAFTGDALLIRGCGRTDFQQGSSDQLFDSVRGKIFDLGDDTFIYPGHDYKGITVSTVAEEKKYNPRLNLNKSKEDFIEIMDNLNLPEPKKIHEALPANLQCGQVDE